MERGNVFRKRLFAVQSGMDGTITIRQPTAFLDYSVAPVGTQVPVMETQHSRNEIEAALVTKALNPMLDEIIKGREKEVRTITNHMEISLNSLIDKVQCQFADLHPLKRIPNERVFGKIKSLRQLDELNNRLEKRRAELLMERQCTIDNIQHIGSAWVLPHPERRHQQWRLWSITRKLRK